MQTTIQKWGNSLALRIPKAFAEQMGIKSDTKVMVTLEDDRIAISKCEPAPVTLDQLLSGVTKKNLHKEVETGPATGKEVW